MSNIEPEIAQAFKNFKRAKKLFDLEKEKLLVYFDEDVITEFHYNGLNGIRNRYPEYIEIFEEYKKS